MLYTWSMADARSLIAFLGFASCAAADVLYEKNVAVLNPDNFPGFIKEQSVCDPLHC